MGGRRQRVDLDDGDPGIKRQKNNALDLPTENPWTGMPFSQRYYSILEKRFKLPVYQFKKELVDKVLENQCVVVEGETGRSWKSTFGKRADKSVSHNFLPHH